MQDFTEAVLLRLFIGECDNYEGQPLYEAIVPPIDLHRPTCESAESWP